MVLGNIFSDHLFDRVSSKHGFYRPFNCFIGNFAMSKVGLSTGVFTIIIFMSMRYLGMGMVKMPLTDYGLGSVPVVCRATLLPCLTGASK